MIHRAATMVVRDASLAAFATQFATVAATIGPRDWGPWRRLNLGWSFWVGLGNESAILAGMCLVAFVFLAIFQPGDARDRVLKNRCVWLNFVTIALLSLVPAVACI